MSGFNRMGRALAPAHIAGPYRCRQSVVRRVRQRNCLSFCFEGLHAKHGTEDFLSHDRHRTVDVIEYSWRNIAPASFLYLPLKNRYGACIETLLYVVLDSI